MRAFLALAVLGLVARPSPAVAADPPAPRPLVWASVGLGGIVPLAHPGAGAFFDTMELLHEHSKDGPSAANLRITGHVGVPVLPVLDVVLEGSFWFDFLRRDYEWVFSGDLGVAVRYAPWRWGVLGVGFLLGGGAAFPTHRVEGRDVGRATGYGRVGVDVMVDTFLTSRVFVEYTLVAHEYAFEGFLAHPVGGFTFGWEIGFGVLPRPRDPGPDNAAP